MDHGGVGRIVCELTAEGGRCRLFRLRPRPQPQAARLLIGHSIPEALALLPNIVPVCGRAHSAAMLGAVENALGRAAPPALSASRAIAVLLEMAVNIAWRLSIDWPSLIGEAAAPERVAAVKRAAATVAAALGLQQDGCVRDIRAASNAADEAVGALRETLQALFPEVSDAASLDATLDAIAAGSSIPARIIATAFGAEFAQLGAHDLPLFAAPDASWFARRLEDETFGDFPAAEASPAEVGPLAEARHPVAIKARARWGASLPARCLAAALDAAAIEGLLRAAIARFEPHDAPALSYAGAGTGCAVVSTARGPLAYRVSVAGGRVTDVRSAAPTEWNFHPQGPFARAIAQLGRMPDAERAVRFIAASFDPCVPVHIVWRSAAAAKSERATLHA